MSEFSGIEGIPAWRKKFSELLKDAKAAAKSTKTSDRLKQVKRLGSFIEKSRPNDSEEIMAMDEIATQIGSDLLQANMDDRVNAIVARTNEYKLLEKQAKAQAEANHAAAKSLKLEGAKKTIETLTESIGMLRELKALAEGTHDGTFLQQLDTLSDEIKAFRDRLEDEDPD